MTVFVLLKIKQKKNRRIFYRKNLSVQFCWVKIWCKVKYEFHQIGIAIIAALTIIRFYLAAIVQTIACRQSWTRGIPEHSSDLTRDCKRRSQFWLHNTNQCWTYRVCLECSATGMGQFPICKLKWDLLRTFVTACTIDKETFSGIFYVRTEIWKEIFQKKSYINP